MKRVRTGLDGDVGLFLVVSLIWGLTWVPIKIGVAAMPPLLFASVRGFLSGVTLLAICWRRNGAPQVARADVPVLGAVAALAYAGGYALLFWGAGHVGSGITAVTNLCLIPPFLLLLGVVMQEESLSRIKVVATLLGVSGLWVLHSAELEAPGGTAQRWAILAIAFSSVVFAAGIVLSRRLLRKYPATLVSGWMMVAGAALLLLASIAMETGSPSALSHLVEGRVLISLAFLVIFGSVVAFTGYLRLTNRWSPSRAGFYAFVSPSIAVVAGIALLGEQLTQREVTGMVLMLMGTLLLLRGRRQEEPAGAAR